MILFGALRPSYSHSANDISELGALGTPNATLWNLVGFIGPGLLLAVAGGAIAVSVGSKRSRSCSLARWLLVVSGLAIAGQGFFPAEMANGVAVVTSWSTRGHFIMSMISGIAWIIGALLLVAPMKRSPDWRGWHTISVALVLLAVAGVFTLQGRLPHGFAQRIVDAIYFAWFVSMSLKLVQLGGNRSAAHAQ
jgi:hypothetical membrane protein